MAAVSNNVVTVLNHHFNEATPIVLPVAKRYLEIYLQKMEDRNTEGSDNDEDVIIPDEIAFPLVVSSHLLLVTAVVALVYAILYQWTLVYGVFATAFFLYLTSVYHWRQPRFSSIARRLDYIAVFAALTFGSYVATTLTSTFILIWFVGLAIVGIIFTTNEYFYYLQVMRNVDGSSSSTANHAANHLLDGAFDLERDDADTPLRQIAIVATVPSSSGSADGGGD